MLCGSQLERGYLRTPKRPGNRWVEYRIRVLYSLENDFEFAIFHMYVSTVNNKVQCDLSRFPNRASVLQGGSLGFNYVAVSTIVWPYVASRLHSPGLILSSDNNARSRLIMQFVEKMIAIYIPEEVLRNIRVTIFGDGSRDWCDVVNNRLVGRVWVGGWGGGFNARRRQIPDRMRARFRPRLRLGFRARGAHGYDRYHYA